MSKDDTSSSSGFSLFGNNTSEETETPKAVENDQIRRDMIAAALLGPCKPLNRKMLEIRAQTTIDPNQAQQAEQQMWKCLEGFANNFYQQHGNWGSAQIIDQGSNQNNSQSPSIQGGSPGDIYYFERMSGKTQWDRPAYLETIINQGKQAKDQTLPIHDCEFLQLNFFICLQSTRAQKTHCDFENDKLIRCIRAKHFQK
ncbi:predicted protein [Naegleria gruberi]|uniref:Predicted protein n=1 Tax=Naegleria gruberi TaxID=5762 RepID=D2UZW3_NAEGR|nr:uncharacterized protein NAEGRDRAFT_62084 [Naegleria gruberi]EFC50234.1 predicted protein [Naegleria gruberi]|eukprot:XP_002682978.1 predicted protein [Naegleria gruberi strain NEG-M]